MSFIEHHPDYLLNLAHHSPEEFARLFDHDPVRIASVLSKIAESFQSEITLFERELRENQESIEELEAEVEHLEDRLYTDKF